MRKIVEEKKKSRAVQLFLCIICVIMLTDCWCTSCCSVGQDPATIEWQNVDWCRKIESHSFRQQKNHHMPRRLDQKGPVIVLSWHISLLPWSRFWSASTCTSEPGPYSSSTFWRKVEQMHRCMSGEMGNPSRWSLTCCVRQWIQYCQSRQTVARLSSA